MAFDGITIAAMVSELNKNLSGGRINKIAQPESDELLILALPMCLRRSMQKLGADKGLIRFLHVK